MDVLAALPREIREEMMQRYGLSDGGRGKGEVIELSDDEDSVGEIGSAESEGVVKREDTSSCEGELQRGGVTDSFPPPPQQGSRITNSTLNDHVVWEDPQPAEEQEIQKSQREIDLTTSDDELEDSGTCPKCGTYVFGFAADAHERWHEEADAEDL